MTAPTSPWVGTALKDQGSVNEVLVTKSSDEGKVLMAAAEVFRRKGYTASADQDLLTATGISTSQLWSDYQDKAGLFEAALSAYVREVVERRLAPLLAPGAGLEHLRRFLHEGVTGPSALDAAGCLLPTIASELGAEAPLPLRVTWVEMREAFADVLANAGSAAPEEEALATLGLLQGLLVLRRAGEPLPALLTAVDRFIAALDRG